MIGGAVHQVGSQIMTVPNLMHPWPTVNMGQDKRVSFLWYRVRKFEPMYFLDQNREFHPSSICVTAPCLAKLADMTGTLPASICTLHSPWYPIGLQSDSNRTPRTPSGVQSDSSDSPKTEEISTKKDKKKITQSPSSLSSV
jgi:hypothetical protein